MPDQYWEEIGKAAREERAKAIKIKIDQRSRLNRAYWSRQWKVLRTAKKKGENNYKERLLGNLVLCLGRCRKHLPIASFHVLMNGRAAKRCLACEAILRDQQKRTREKKLAPNCARCGERIPMGSKLRVCNPCFNAMNYVQRSNVLLGGTIRKLRTHDTGIK